MKFEFKIDIRLLTSLCMSMETALLDMMVPEASYLRCNYYLLRETLLGLQKKLSSKSKNRSNKEFKMSLKYYQIYVVDIFLEVMIKSYKTDLETSLKSDLIVIRTKLNPLLQ